MWIVKWKEHLNQELYAVVIFIMQNMLHVFAENFPVLNHKKSMLNQINVMLMTTDSIDSIPIGCRFSDSQIMAARNRSLSQTDGLSKTITLKLETKIYSSRILI